MKALNLFGLLLFSLFTGCAYAGSAATSWETVTDREDGSSLIIGGYEIVYRSTAVSEYTTIIIEDPAQTTFEIENISGEHEFMIAVFDTNGLRSNFTSPLIVDILDGASKPSQVIFNVESLVQAPTQNAQDIIDACIADPICTVDVKMTIPAE